MKRTSEFPTMGGSPRGTLVPDRSQVAWEYRFCNANELEAEGVTADGWRVMSSSMRKDAHRVFLLKRPRQ
jgi:hypothetical protein